nr:basic proline-rich protein [Camelus dromedarius]
MIHPSLLNSYNTKFSSSPAGRATFDVPGLRLDIPSRSPRLLLFLPDGMKPVQIRRSGPAPASARPPPGRRVDVASPDPPRAPPPTAPSRAPGATGSGRPASAPAIRSGLRTPLSAWRSSHGELPLRTRAPCPPRVPGSAEDRRGGGPGPRSPFLPGPPASRPGPPTPGEGAEAGRLQRAPSRPPPSLQAGMS